MERDLWSFNDSEMASVRTGRYIIIPIRTWIPHFAGEIPVSGHQESSSDISSFDHGSV